MNRNKGIREIQKENIEGFINDLSRDAFQTGYSHGYRLGLDDALEFVFRFLQSGQTLRSFIHKTHGEDFDISSVDPNFIKQFAKVMRQFDIKLKEKK